MSSDWNSGIDRLVYRVQRQDKLALEELYERTNSKLLGLIIRIVKNQHEAEDVLQDLFVKIWQQASKYTGKGHAWGWLCVMARHSSIDHLRKLKAHTVDSTDESPEFLNQLSEANKQINSRWIGQCLEKLKPIYRQVIVMSFFSGHSHSEMSKELATPLGTIKARSRRGLLELKKCLAA